MINNAAVFPGQGNFVMEEFKKVLKENTDAQDIFNKATKLICRSEEELIQDDDKYNTYNLQILTFLSSYIYFKIFKNNIDDEFCIYAGHSLGEITALVCADVITFDEGLLYIDERAKVMEACITENTSGMTAVFNGDIDLLEVLSENYKISISNYNSKKQVVFSGTKERLEKLETDLKRRSISFKRLNVAGAFHSNLMKEASDKLKDTKFNYNPDNIDRVFSSCLGRLYNKEDNLPEILSKQILQPVNWIKVIEKMKEDHITNIIEFGTKPVLKSFFNNSFYNMFDIVVSSEEDYEKNYRNNSSKLYLKFLKKIISIAVCTKNYTEELQIFEEYKLSYRSLLDKCDEFIMNDRQVDSSICQFFYDSLFCKLLPLKSVPESEVVDRKNELLKEFHIGGFKWEY